MRNDSIIWNHIHCKMTLTILPASNIIVLNEFFDIWNQVRNELPVWSLFVEFCNSFPCLPSGFINPNNGLLITLLMDKFPPKFLQWTHCKQFRNATTITQPKQA
jgi:hypothetical protein